MQDSISPTPGNEADSSSSADEDACPVCYGPLQLRGGVPIINPGCGHELHISCFSDLHLNHIAPKCLICQSRTLSCLLLNRPPANPPTRFAPLPFRRRRSPLWTMSLSLGLLLRTGRMQFSIQILAEYSSVPQVTISNVNVNFLVSIKAPDLPEDPLTADTFRGAWTGTSVDLVVVVDTSGSMAGRPLATVQNTLRHIFTTLDPADRLAIVAFSNAATQITPLWHVIPPNAGKCEAAIAGLRAGCGTLIPAGLRTGIEVLSRRTTSNPNAAILLLSDGQDDRHAGAGGMYDSLIAMARNVGPVYTFGIGRDHDSALLSRLAGSSGSFTYLDNMNVLRDSFSGCLGAIRSTVLTTVAARVGSSADNLDGYIISGGPAKQGMSGEEWAFYIALIKDIDKAMPLVRDSASFLGGGRSITSTFQRTHSGQRAVHSIPACSHSATLYQTPSSLAPQRKSSTLGAYSSQTHYADVRLCAEARPKTEVELAEIQLRIGGQAQGGGSAQDGGGAGGNQRPFSAQASSETKGQNPRSFYQNVHFGSMPAQTPEAPAAVEAPSGRRSTSRAPLATSNQNTPPLPDTTSFSPASRWTPFRKRMYFVCE
ncbi:hypothetical protein BDK51DRAFT_26072 [Blyttiomyces helicus]|uniref:VWFA domain-containing protein n=1 Tax=Blyttiomyces helicus TaxID=388810 RepID=A0A4P9W8S9_9FUNG|nr:hypothetical protein BDK51DRAFT_26072 [Blyttiomyces helicus]|eukprot:RKO87873.1 hypothetical protein BDK51DRAFT_26072 [Blyttiomyces helicus]